MRIAVIHSFYAPKNVSGENLMVEQQIEALREAGHEVMVISRTSPDTPSLTYKLASGIRTSTGWGADPLKQLTNFRPDICHVHNLFPNFGRAWIKRSPAPVVTTLHNFRPLCASGLLLRDGKVCMECLGSWTPAVRYKCYKGSRSQTIPLALQTRHAARANAVLSDTAGVIVLSERAKAIYQAAGVSEDKLHLVMNFGPDHNYHAKENSAAPYVFLGRLTEEKGITHLAANWPSNKRLLVYGDGPLMNATKAIENPGLEIMGRVARTDIPKILAGSRALVISTECAEGAVATTYIEALSAGIPTVALAGSSAADHISANGTGLVYSNYSELDDALDKLNRDWRSFSNQVDRVYAEQFTKDVWLRNINSLYESMRDGSVVGRRTDNQ